ncbi:MAG: ubiquinone biosynthesis accessory factor UbiJ [Dokdonella sp.]|uniref:ubiquinone biosynthesis accessory factor UbiJ n=1 Tax=Dokdonella sp. TaxID=2291710 RepID=UPI003F7F3E55
MSAAPPVRTPNPLLAALGRVLETVLDRAAGLDPETRARLAALDGRAVTLDLAGATGRSAPALRIRVGGDRLRVGPAFEGDSALRVAATPGSLLGLAFARGRDDALPPGRVQIAGDAELARRLEQLARGYAPDIDAAFAQAFGDVAGTAIARAVRGAFGGARASARSLARDAAEFLTEEGRDLVARAELDGFLDDVDALRERAERLDARVQRLRTGRA